MNELVKGSLAQLIYAWFIQVFIMWLTPWVGKMIRIPAMWWATRAGKMAQQNSGLFPYNKSFVEQACSVKMAWYWPRLFFCVSMFLDSVSVSKHAKEITWPISSHLDRTSWVNNPYLMSVSCQGILVWQPIFQSILPACAVAFWGESYYFVDTQNHCFTVGLSRRLSLPYLRFCCYI